MTVTESTESQLWKWKGTSYPPTAAKMCECEEKGGGIVHRLRGRPSNRKLPEELRARTDHTTS
jgi:hypothetical protein